MNPETIATALEGKKSGAGYLCRCPAHADEHASLSVNDGDKGVVVHCHAGCTQDAVIEALQSRGLWTAGTKQKRRPREIVATYDYRDPDNKIAYQVVRYAAPKDFRQRRPDGNGGWLWDMDGVARVLYRLPQLIEAVAAKETVYVVEGEKDVESLHKLGLPATTNPAGAGKWTDEYSKWLKRARVVILPDNDETGRQHAKKVLASLSGIAEIARIVELPDVPPKGDISDWIASGGTREQLQQIIEAPEQGVDGARLLDDVRSYIERFVAFPNEHCLAAVTLWAAHAHMVEFFYTTPRLALLSPEPSSGKTRVLEVLDLLVPESLFCLSASPAAIFRTLASKQITLLVDEVDAIFSGRGKDDSNEDLRALLNAGYKRGATIPRCVGPYHEVQSFTVHAATALAGLGDLPETIMSRSIVIRMRRRGPDERVESFREREQAPFGHELRERIAKWAAAVGPRAGAAWPMLPAGVVDRFAEIWEPLIAAADEAGGHWRQTARTACTAMREAYDQKVSLGVRLLADLRTIFGEAVALHTKTILDRLCHGEQHGLEADAPWGELHGKPLGDRGLASLLKRYGVHATKVNVDGVSLQGYRRDPLWDAWSRYLSPPPGKAECPEHAELVGRSGFSQGSGQVPDTTGRPEPPDCDLRGKVPEVPDIPDSRHPESAADPDDQEVEF